MSDTVKTPPHNLESERSVLGACMLEKDAIVRVADLLQKEDFYDSRHADIYEAIADLFMAHNPVDVITVADWLNNRKLLDKVGGPSFLAELTVECPSSVNVYQYAQIVKTKSTLRRLLTCGRQITDLAYQTERDLSEVLEESEQKMFSVTQAFVKNHFIHIKDIVQGRFEEFSSKHDNPDKSLLQGISYGFRNIDYYTQGLKPGELIILAARPSMGKSAFSLNVVQDIALRQKKVVGFFSLEMPKEQMVDRLFSSVLGVNSFKLQKGQLTEEEFSNMAEKMQEMSDAEIYFDDTGGLNPTELKSKARRLQMERGLDFIVIDYLQLMTGNNPLNRVQEVSDISRALKSMAKELQIPVMVLSQLNRSVEQRPNKRPVLSDLRDSGSIEQDADVVLMLYRESYYDPDTEFPNRADVFIKKNRNGPIGDVEMVFEMDKGRFLVPEHNFDFSEAEA